jgi:pimeloyl-ACP methyl ester carboxylesterase
MAIPYFDLGGDGLPLHFLHANGYPPDCYKPLFELLKTQYHVFGMHLRPLWDGSRPEEIRDWHPLSDDLLRFIASTAPTAPLSANNKSVPVIGVGHSIGAMVTLRAALREPGKFRALVLVDPVLFVPSVLYVWKIVRAVGLGNKLHPKIRTALKRRQMFDNLDLVFRGYRSRSIFRFMSDENLRIYIEGITKPSEDGTYQLRYSPEWESHIYLTAMNDFDIWRGLPQLEVPTLIIRGAETDTFLPGAAKLVKRKQPKVRVEALGKSTHILPLERPQEVFEIMQSFLKPLESGS